MTLVFEILDGQFKIKMISMLRALIKKKKVNNIQEQIGNISREMETFKMALKENAKNKKQ